MNPRREDSKRWVNLPGELNTQIRDVFTTQFSGGDEVVFRCQGRIYKKEILLQVGRHESGKLAQANFEISMDYDIKKENVLQLVLKAVDLAGALMTAYLEDEEVDFPRTWAAHQVEGKGLFYRFNTENQDLEAEANKLLGVTGDDSDALVGGDEEDDETLKLTLEKLGLSEEDLPDPSERH